MKRKKRGFVGAKAFVMALFLPWVTGCEKQGIRDSRYRTTQVKVYFVDTAMFMDGTAQYSDMIKPVIRTVPGTGEESTVRAAIEELLKGPTTEETAQGYMSQIPDAKQISIYASLCAGSIPSPYSGDRVRLLSPRIQDKVAYADFGNELEAYGGGSAVIMCIWPQIVKTVTQFSFIEDVEISIEGRIENILQP